jgi:hypothetical protein
MCQSTASQLPVFRHIRRAVRRHKKNTLQIPLSLETMTISQPYQVTHSDEPFLLYDSGIYKPNRIPIYSIATILVTGLLTVHLKLLCNYSTIHVLVDNNIKVWQKTSMLMPSIFLTTPTIHLLPVLVGAPDEVLS